MTDKESSVPSSDLLGYIVVEANSSAELVLSVPKYIAEGYEPCGGVVVAWKPGQPLGTWAQAMTRRPNTKLTTPKDVVE